MNNSRLLVLASVLLIGELILIIIFKNLPPPLSKFAFYFVPFLVIVVLSKPNLLFNKTILILLLFASFYILMFFIGIYENESEFYNIGWLFRVELMPIFVSCSLFIIFSVPSKINYLIVIIKYTLLFILITSITSIFGLIRYPYAARELAGSLGMQEKFELISFYKKIGIAGYDFFYGLAYIMPVFVVIIKKHWNLYFMRTILLCFLLFFIAAIILSQMTTALICAIIGVLFSIIGVKDIKKSIAYFILTIVLIFFIPNQFYSNAFRELSTHVPGEILQSRLLDISIVIENSDQEIIDEETHISSRAQRIPFLLENILKSPIIGGGPTTGHNFWLDRISKFGLLGVIPWLIFYINIMKITVRKIKREYVYYYYLSIILYISVGFIKGSGGYITYILIIFVMPSLYIIYSYNKNILPKLHTSIKSNQYII